VTVRIASPDRRERKLHACTLSRCPNRAWKLPEIPRFSRL
jgi:hypothetical protein